MRQALPFTLILMMLPWALIAKLPEIQPQDVGEKVREIMEAHVRHKEMNEVIMKRTLKNFIDSLDPGKTYLIEEEIEPWMELEDRELQRLITQYHQHDFTEFEKIHGVMTRAISRRNGLEAEIATSPLPSDVNPKEFKDLTWAQSEGELKERLARIRSLQQEASEHLEKDQQELAMQRIQKRRQKYEEDLLESQPTEKTRLILSQVLKAIAGSLDAHTAYFTPGEATQFMINVQQRLFGIGAQLRDDLNGFSVVKIIEGGPAAEGKELKNKDRIIAVDGEPVVGMDIVDAVELIRGQEGTAVRLTVMRDQSAEGQKQEEKLDIQITRGEVVLKETRLESDVEPFGDGAIAYLKLYSFYQDPESSSAQDIRRELSQLNAEHSLKGVVLDLRYNSGGMLSQAVAVSGLFITRGVVVSIKDDHGRVQHLRDLDGKTLWNGPLVVLVNRASASAAEIVSQTLQDYGRAIVVGDDHTYGKGTFQTFTINSNRVGQVNPQGEYKVTRGTYYTVSGKSPQLNGVQSDIVIPGVLSEVEIGEQYSEFPLDSDSISPLFDDELLDVPEPQRLRVAQLYRMNLQPRLHRFSDHLHQLEANSTARLEKNKNYQAFLEQIQKDDVEREDLEQFEGVDFQLTESYNVIKDLIILMG